MVSLINSLLTCGASPLFLMNPDVSVGGAMFLAASLCTFGIGTTLALHWFTSPYVHELRFHRASEALELKTLTVLGRERWRRYALSDVGPPAGFKPLGSFSTASDGATFYIDRKGFPDAELLTRLTPVDAAMQAMAAAAAEHAAQQARRDGPQ